MPSAILAPKNTWKSLCRNENENLEINENKNRDKLTCSFWTRYLHFADPMIERQDKRRGLKENK